MTNKLLTNAREPTYDGIKTRVITQIELMLLQKKLELLKLGMLIPDTLISEMESFASRNIIIEEKNQQTADYMQACCPSCLKAHAVSSAKKIGLNNKAISALQNSLKGNLGHNGYYLDGEELVKL